MNNNNIQSNGWEKIFNNLSSKMFEPSNISNISKTVTGWSNEFKACGTTPQDLEKFEQIVNGMQRDINRSFHSNASTNTSTKRKVTIEEPDETKEKLKNWSKNQEKVPPLHFYSKGHEITVTDWD